MKKVEKTPVICNFSDDFDQIIGLLQFISSLTPGNCVFFTWKTWNLVLKIPDYRDQTFSANGAYVNLTRS